MKPHKLPFSLITAYFIKLNATYTPKKIIIWLVGVSFLLFQFFLQLTSGIVVGAIMSEYQFSALIAGLLSSSFYYIYVSLQIPVGILFDRYNTRSLFYINAAICAVGCFIMACAHSLLFLFLGRLIIGAGSAFAFVGLSHLIRQNFPLKNFAFIAGLTETVGFTATVFGMIGLGTVISTWGWRFFIFNAGVAGLFIAFLCWLYLPDHRPPQHETHYKQALLTLLKNKLLWLNGLFACLEFSLITVFASMWAVPFIQLKLNCTIKTASFLTSLTMLGTGLSCPLFGYLHRQTGKQKLLIHSSCFSTAFFLVLILYGPFLNLTINSLLFFLTGLCCGAYMLAYTISNQLCSAEVLSTGAGFTNTLGMMSAPLLQPIVGYLLDSYSKQPGVYSLTDYQKALIILPLALIIASTLAHFLPEEKV